jgi:hypothetical protein
MYSLNWSQPGRRTGLTRGGYKAPSLLQSVNSPNNRNTLRPKLLQSAPKEKMSPTQEVLSEEDIYALPKDDSDTSEEESASRAADIKPTLFIRRGPEDPNASPRKANRAARKSEHEGLGTFVKSKTSRGAKYTSSSRPISPESSCKRKILKDDLTLGTGIADPFGRVKKARPGKTYGSVSQKSRTKRTHLKDTKGMLIFLVCKSF